MAKDSKQVDYVITQYSLPKALMGHRQVQPRNTESNFFVSYESRFKNKIESLEQFNYERDIKKARVGPLGSKRIMNRDTRSQKPKTTTNRQSVGKK